ncbi:unnamed protein product [Linum trigynum]|uniref:Retrotransposon gag domain-containing protein n=1 Tax=Linum trigynum TaxID=586398 RepID=A0AAV2CH18_9ROSI
MAGNSTTPMKEVVESRTLRGLSPEVEETVELEDQVKDHGKQISEMQSNISQILTLIKEGMREQDNPPEVSGVQRDKGKKKVVVINEPEEEAEDEELEADLSFLEEHLQSSFGKSSTKGKGPSVLHNALAKRLFKNPMPPNFSSLGLSTYDGSTDPGDHLSAFTLKMQLINATDADMCKAFPITFGGRCRSWYTSLPEGIIDNFEQFATLFSSKFASQIRRRLTVSALINCTQGEGEALVDFYDRWNTISCEVQGITPNVAAGNLRMSTQSQELQRDLIKRE